METDNIISPINGTIESKFFLKNTFDDHGNEAEEIISNKLPPIVRWGTVYFFFLLALIGVISWVIKYPDIVVAKAKLNSVNAPKQVIARTDGILYKIFIRENEHVEAGQVLGVMESIADPKSVMIISHQIDSINKLVIENRIDEIMKYFDSNISTLKSEQEGELGELQATYQTFIQSCINFIDFLNRELLFRKHNLLIRDLSKIKRLHEIAVNRKSLYQQGHSLSSETINADEPLVKDKITFSPGYPNDKSKLTAKEPSLPQINAFVISNESQESEKRIEIGELGNQINIQKNAFIQSLQTIKSQIYTWEFKYLLKAPVAGTVSFNGFFEENQEMKAGQTLFYIQPSNTSYFVEMIIPQYNFGKVKQGQQVLLKFQAYPFEQYGSVIGKIDYINPTPTDSGYLAKVILPNGLITNYKMKLQFRNGLFAQADIVANDLRLLERFYYTMRKN